MQHALLAEAYKNLSPTELQKLSVFLNSPYFNQSSLIISLHAYLCSIHPELSPALLDRKKVFTDVFPGESFDDQKMRVFMSRLLRLIERFWVIERIENNPIEHKTQLLKELRERKSPRLMNRSLKQAQTLLENEVIPTARFFLSKYEIQEEWNWFATHAGSSGSRTKPIEHYLQTAVESLDTFYLINKLRYFCTFKNNENILSFRHENFLYNEILDKLSREKGKFGPATSIYMQILLTLVESENEDHFVQLKALLQENADKVEPSMASEMNIYARNYCIKKSNEGNTRYLKELFDLYKNALDYGLLLENEELSPWSFKNITVVGLRLGEFVWVEQFLQDYAPSLPAREQENALTYNLAKLFFYKKEFSKVISQLARVEYNDVFYGLDSRAMLMKTYYELNEIEALMSLTDAFRIFLKRKKILSEVHAKGYNNLIKFVRKLAKVQPGSRKKLAQLKTEVSQTKPIMDIDWLFEKLNELT